MALNKQQKERITLAALLVVAALVWFFYFGNSNSASSGPVRPGAYTPISAEDYTVIFKDMQASQATVYKPSGRNIFIAGAVPVTTAENGAPVKPTKPQPLYPTVPVPVPPPPPILSMKFFGYGSLPTSGPRRAFLLDGEEIHIVEEGDTVQNHIRITHIGNDRIEYEDTVTGKKNSNNLELPPQG
jgi:hypothetical protein